MVGGEVAEDRQIGGQKARAVVRQGMAFSSAVLTQQGLLAHLQSLHNLLPPSHHHHNVRRCPGPRQGGMPPGCLVLVCSWWRPLADCSSLPFPWTLSLHWRWCPSASHPPCVLPLPPCPIISSPLPFPFPWSVVPMEPPDVPCSSSLCKSTWRRANALAVGQASLGSRWAVVGGPWGVIGGSLGVIGGSLGGHWAVIGGSLGSKRSSRTGTEGPPPNGGPQQPRAPGDYATGPASCFWTS